MHIFPLTVLGYSAPIESTHIESKEVQSGKAGFLWTRQPSKNGRTIRPPVFSILICLFHLIFPASRAGKAHLRAVPDADKVFAVLDEYGKRRHTQNDERQPAAADGGIDRERDNARHGADDDVIRQHSEDNNRRENAQRNLLVDGEDHAEIRGKALAALEFEIEREHMSQHARHARNEAEQRHRRENPLGELDREYGLADVMDGDEQSRLPSHERKSVGSAEIFRPAGAKVHALPPGEIQCHVGTADEVCAENGDDVGKHSRPLSTEGPRENLVFLSNQEILNLFYITRKRRRCQALVFRRTSCAACA